VAEPVPESWFASGRLHAFGQSLVRTMLEAEGVGLAAPQVEEGLRLFSYWLPPDDDLPGIEPVVLVNPELKVVDGELEEGWEGCLSIPGLRGLVPRHRRIKVRARLVDGSTVSLTAERFPRPRHPARVRPPRRDRLPRPHDLAAALWPSQRSGSSSPPPRRGFVAVATPRRSARPRSRTAL